MTENPTERPDVATLSYEQARAELINVVQRLEAGGATLEESLELWERGEQLAQALVHPKTERPTPKTSSAAG